MSFKARQLRYIINTVQSFHKNIHVGNLWAFDVCWNFVFKSSINCVNTCRNADVNLVAINNFRAFSILRLSSVWKRTLEHKNLWTVKRYTLTYTLLLQVIQQSFSQPFASFPRYILSNNFETSRVLANEWTVYTLPITAEQLPTVATVDFHVPSRSRTYFLPISPFAM